MNVQKILETLVGRGAADIFFISGRTISYKTNQKMTQYEDGESGNKILLPNDIMLLMEQIYALANRGMDHLIETGDDDFSFSIKGVSRFRANVYKQRGSFAAVIRTVTFSTIDPKKLNIPDKVLELADKQYGLVLVTGPAYTGKTTTLSCIVNEINEKHDKHIITLEDPIEYLHSHKKSIISQREISLDTQNYVVALRAALRQSPDVILIGELRDEETIEIALTAAGTGHYVISALHSLGAANAVDRLVDTFPATQQRQARMQLSMVLQTVVCQQLVPTLSGSVIPVFEVMHCTDAIRNLIRDGRTHQINSFIQSSAEDGMQSMDSQLADMYEKGIISKKVAFEHSLIPEYLKRRIGEEE